MALNGRAISRIALYDKTRSRPASEGGTQLYRRIPYNLVTYEQASGGQAFEPVDPTCEGSTALGDRGIELTGVMFLEETDLLNPERGCGGGKGLDFD